MRTTLQTIVTIACLASAEQAQAVLYKVPPKQQSEVFGKEIDRVGDVDADGRPDVIASAVDVVRLFSGPTGHLLFDVEDELAGSSVTGLGDVNGDGHDDFAYGVPFLFSAGGTKGGVKVCSGKTGALLYTAKGDESGSQHGVAVSEVGDVNGDGVPDLAVGAWNATGGIGASGMVYVHSGLNGALLWKYPSFDKDEFGVGNHFGRYVEAAGDQDLDGVPDVFAGPSSYPGIAKVISGVSGDVLFNANTLEDPSSFFVTSLAQLGDVDGDGVSELAVGMPSLNHATACEVIRGGRNEPLYAVSELISPTNYGWRVSGGQDMNGDTLPDLLVTSWIPEFSLTGPPGLVRILSGPDGSLLGEVQSTNLSDEFGWDVASLGDVNGDGWGEFAVSAWFADYFLGDDSGLVWVFSARDALPLTANQYQLPLAPGGGQQLRLQAGAEHAGELYVLLGSLSGIAPGTALGELHLPLNIDDYSLFALTPGASPLAGAVGVLDNAGKANASFVYPPGLSPTLAGTTFDHAFALFDPQTLAPTFTSNSAALVWTP